MPEREVRYCTTADGVRIAYCVEGEGPPLVVLQVFVESFSLYHLVPEFFAFMPVLGLGRQLVHYDIRGTGLSQREVDDVSHQALLRDLEAVVAAAGLKRFALFGQTFGALRAIEYSVRHPRQVTHLILYEGYPRVADIMPEPALRAFADLARTNWPVAAQALVDLRDRRQAPEWNVRTGEVFRRSMSGEMAARLIQSNAGTDVTPLLPGIKAKTLVIHWLQDEFVPLAVAQTMAASVPGARLVTLADSGPQRLEPIREPVAAFLSTEPPTGPDAGPEPQPPVRTVLFTDIVGHTEMMSRLGDERGREVLREHERITREVLRAHGGTEVKTMGDGFMASFGSVTRAVECAVALQRAFDAALTPDPSPAAAGEGSERIQIRCGLNAGEPIEEEGPDGRSDLFGATVILASRIAGRAEGGEILVADTVRGLCSGKGFVFADRGEFTAKGFEEPVRVYEVRWQE